MEEAKLIGKPSKISTASAAGASMGPLFLRDFAKDSLHALGTSGRANLELLSRTEVRVNMLSREV